jgi:short-subunit dehydrogenase
LSLRDGVAVITGAAGGIGAALAQQLAARGMHLALVDVDTLGLATQAEVARALGVRVSVHVCDVADRASVKALPDEVLAVHGRVTVLVNNAGVACGGRFVDLSEADFDWLMNINFGGTVSMTRAFLPVLARQPAAQLVNLSSLFGLIAPPGQSAYSASKFAVRGFSEALRHELEMEGSPVGVTIVHPGGVRTGIARNARIAASISSAEIEAGKAEFDALLQLAPEVAAAQILGAIERRTPRLLVGKDAVQGAWLQRLMPVGYWKLAARGIAAQLKRHGVTPRSFTP